MRCRATAVGLAVLSRLGLVPRCKEWRVDALHSWSSDVMPCRPPSILASACRRGGAAWTLACCRCCLPSCRRRRQSWPARPWTLCWRCSCATLRHLSALRSRAAWGR